MYKMHKFALLILDSDLGIYHDHNQHLMGCTLWHFQQNIMNVGCNSVGRTWTGVNLRNDTQCLYSIPGHHVDMRVNKTHDKSYIGGYRRWQSATAPGMQNDVWLTVNNTILRVFANDLHELRSH